MALLNGGGEYARKVVDIKRMTVNPNPWFSIFPLFSYGDILEYQNCKHEFRRMLCPTCFVPSH